MPFAWVSVTVTVAAITSLTTMGFFASVMVVEVVRAATVIEMAWVEVWGMALASVAVTLTLNGPAAEGVPERSPEGERVRPVGSVPVEAQMMGSVPPLDTNWKPLPLL